MSSKKRAQSTSQSTGGKGRKGTEGRKVDDDEGDEDMTEMMDGLVFEDPFEDEFEEEIIEEGEEDGDGDGDGDEGRMSDEEDDGTRDEDVGKSCGGTQVWRPDVDGMEAGESLEYDPSAYVMYHALQTEWPCLSFDFLRDNLGDGRQRFPLTMFMVSGSQADRSNRNKVTLLKLSELHKTHVSADSDEECDDDDDDLDDDPTLEHVDVPHTGGVNRIRGMPQTPGIVATMSDNGHANIFDMTTIYQCLLDRGPRSGVPSGPDFTFRGHAAEGYALDWSPAVAGQLATGDNAGGIHIWNHTSGGSWQVGATPHRGHTSSIEDIQWSPTEGTVFSSCSADKTVRIWDTRGKGGPQITVDDAHSSDVNVLSWNRNVQYLLASGSDDGSFKVWDLRAVRDKTTLANFTYHKRPIWSIEWAPHDESVLCVASADNQVTIWDLSVEAEDSDTVEIGTSEFPAQLLFIHQGQNNVKEIHHHPQIPGVIVSTAEDGFNVFKPAISVSS